MTKFNYIILYGVLTMGFKGLKKIPGLSGVVNEVVGFGADIIQGGQPSVRKTASRVSDIVVEHGLTSVQRPLNKIYEKLERKTGYGFGRPGVAEILNNPAEALGQFLSGSLKVGGMGARQDAWMPLLQSRPDPLWEIDWLCMLPFDYPPEYVEDISWTQPRLTESSIFRNGMPVHLATGIEVPSISLTLYEDNRLTTMSWYQAFYASIFDEETGTFAYPANYKQTITLVIRDVMQNAVGTVTFHGVFPTGSPAPTHSADGSRVKLQVEFSVDSISFASAIVEDATSTSTSVVQMIKDGLSGKVSGFLNGLSSNTAGAAKTASNFLNKAVKSFSSFF